MNMLEALIASKMSGGSSGGSGGGSVSLPFVLIHLTMNLETGEIYCANMTFDEAIASLGAGAPAIGCVAYGVPGMASESLLCNAVKYFGSASGASVDYIIFTLAVNEGVYYWTADGISNTQPE